MVIEAITRSKFWPQTAVFVVEEDAQNGPDHVDAHRTIAYVISPYVKRGSVDSTMYSYSIMLRTMELILGLKPMSQFDATAMRFQQILEQMGISAALRDAGIEEGDTVLIGNEILEWVE